jgi:hypothetical protein
MRSRAGELTPTRPPILEGFRRRLDGPRAGPFGDRLRQLVDGQLGVPQRIADGREDLVRLP